MSCIVRSLLAALSIGSSLAAQARWQLAPMLGIREGHAMAFDSLRGRTVLFGGGDRSALGRGYAETWEWDGREWVFARSAVSPSVRALHAMAFDSRRNRTVLFGGSWGFPPLGDTWEWDGTQWQQRSPNRSPAPQHGHAMAFDPVRRQVVLLDVSGGFWAWTGDDWQPVASATRPSVRSSASLATDTTRGRVVLFGGRNASTLLADTWEWDGTNWQERLPGVAPPAREHHVLLEAPNGVLLFGGYDLSDTWTWDGQTWTQRVSGPFAGAWSAGAFDSLRRRTVLFGGNDGPGDHTWEWDGTAWSLRDRGPPRERQFHAMAYDPVRRRTVLFGGYGVSYWDDTWEWDGLRWHRQSPVHSPGFRHGHAMAFASNAGHVVLFGGNYDGLHLGDTWLWDGSDWRQVACSRAPTPRKDHRMTWDPVRQRVLLFGGGRDMATYGDLWEWDGTCWTQQTAAAPLPTRAGHIQAFEPTTGRLLIAGGLASFGFLADTWAWDGTSWAQLQTLPTGFSYMSTALDMGRGRIVVHGGYGEGQFYRDQTLEFHPGTGWVQTTRSGPSGRHGSAMAYHQATGRVVLFAGVENDLRAGFELTRDTWELVPDHLARWTSQGPGCAGMAGIPQLQLWRDQLPWLGEPFVLRLLRLPPGQATLLWLGASDTAWGAVPLPLDLTPIGMPGCALRMSPDLVFPLFQWTGEAALSVGIPNDPVLRGNTFYAQGLAVDPRANALGLVVSDAGAATVGTR